MSKSNSSSGFTAIETLVTLVIAVIFILAINTLFITVIRSTASARNRANASTLAYSYLRQYAYTGALASWFTCDNTTDLRQHASAGGQSLSSGTLNSTQTSLPQPVSFSVRAFAPYGCDSANEKSPLLVRATVTYGPDDLTVDHATYLGRLE